MIVLKIMGQRRVGQGIFVLAALFLFIFSNSADAIRLNLSGTNLPSGMTGPVELYRQVGSFDPPGGGDDVKIRLVSIVGGLLANPEIPIAVSGANIPAVSGGVEKTPNALDDIDQGTMLYIRVWDGATGKSHYYAESAVKSITWLETDPAVNWDIGSWTKYLADAPQGVGVKVDSESMQRNGFTQALTLGISAIDGGQTAIQSSVLEISKDPSFGDVSDPTGGAKHFNAASATVSGSYFTAGTYYIRAQKTNNYGTVPASLLTTPVQDIAKPGDSVVDAVGRYSTLGGSVVTETTEVWVLRQPAGKTGVNTIAIPFILSKSIKDNNGAEITPFAKIGHLIKAINDQANANVVTVFGWYEEGVQAHKGLISITDYNPDRTVKTATATAGSTTTDILDSDIVLDRPYQVSVNQDNVTFKLTGMKQ